MCRDDISTIFDVSNCLMCFYRLNKMSTTTCSDGSSNPQCGSQASQVQSDSIPISRSPQLESTNDSQPIEIDDDEEEEDVMAGSKRKLKSAVGMSSKSEDWVQ